MTARTESMMTPADAPKGGASPQPAQGWSLGPRNIWRIAKPYWISNDRWIGLAMFASILALIGADVWFSAWLTGFTKQSFDALEQRDANAFTALIATSIWMVAIGAAIFAVDQLFRRSLAFRWRKGLVQAFTERWFAEHAFYRLERLQSVDNPDQRIADDLGAFTDQTLSVGMTFLWTAAQFAFYGHMLWVETGSQTLGGVTIPGYMFWCAVLFGAIYSGGTHLVGRGLANLTMKKQQVEADFRFALAQQREAAEQIALYRGAEVEKSRLRRLFGAIASNWNKYMAQSLRVNFVSQTFMFYSTLLPTFVMAPQVLSGQSTLGDLMQNQLAFSSVAIGIAWFGQAYFLLVEWAAVTRRLIGLDQSLSATERRGIEVCEHDQHCVSARALQLALPDGRMLANLGDIRFGAGERWLIRGPSGVGKSTLLRAIAGLWPHGQGRIELPPPQRTMFLPQKSYLPSGTLKEALTYPKASSAFSDEACRRILADCELPHLRTELHDGGRWAHTLSVGEQQRLAFARVLLARPGFVFLDEATSALDPDTEAAMYRLLIDRLPGSTLISVAHRPAVAAFHEHTLELTALRG